MRVIIFIIVICLLFSLSASASFKKWTNTQKKLSISYVGLITTDLIQSQHWVEYTEDNPRHYNDMTVWEKNPLVAGKSIETATIMAIGGGYLLYKIADGMESNHRTIFLIGANLIEGYVVYTNHKIMKKFGFEYKIKFINFSF